MLQAAWQNEIASKSPYNKTIIVLLIAFSAVACVSLPSYETSNNSLNRFIQKESSVKRRSLIEGDTFSETLFKSATFFLTSPGYSGDFGVSAVTLMRQDIEKNYQDRKEEQSDKSIKQILMNYSINQYSGSCPCPYFGDRAGRRCGGRSAYSRPGGASPLCYESDVSNKMVRQYREIQRRQSI